MAKVKVSNAPCSHYNNLLKKRKERENNRKKNLTKEERDIKTKEWTTFYRRNWNIYAKHELGIPLYFFQEVVIYLMGVSEIFYFMCSRGLSKSFLAGMTAFIKCMLYPYSEVVLTATTIKTAKKMVKNKMEGEFCGKMSPKLKYLYDKGLICFTYNQEDIRIDFKFNNSWILILPEAESSRGERSTCTIFEEVRLMKRSMVDSVFSPMSRPRQAKFLENPEYQKDKRLIDESQKIYLTSTRYKFEWFWGRWKQTVEDTFNDKRIRYNFFAGDIYTAIEHGLKTETELFESKRSMSDMEFRMEMLNEAIGEAEGAFYTLEEFKEACVIVDGFVPPTPEEFLINYQRGSLEYFREKEEGEVRVVYVDFAFSDTVKKTQENDMTVIGCMSGYPNEDGDRIFRNAEYMETYSGGKKDESILKIRELFYLYKADYLVVDFRNGGEDRWLELSKPFRHDEMGMDMNGFGIVRDFDLTTQFCERMKLENLISREIDPYCVNVVIPVIGSAERNNNFHIAMKNSLQNHTFRMLVDTDELKLAKSEDVKFLSLSGNELMRRTIGHVQLSLTILEFIGLEKEIKNGFLKLKEPRSGLKDRAISTEMSNYLFQLLELQMVKKQQESEIDLNDWTIIV